MPTLANHSRIVVVGTSCCGKTTFCRRLATALGRRHIELDALHWGANWTPNPDFLSRVEAAVAGDDWIVDGNYTLARGAIWSRATALVWLNFGFPLVFWRSLRRTCRRIATREKLYSGNQESVVHSFLHWDGIPWWVLRTFHSRRRELRTLLQEPEFAHLQVFELRHPAQAEALLVGSAERWEQKGAEIAKVQE
jgi:adenylate kinase family enzyme